MNQVTCSVCDLKTDESKWKEHIILAKRLQLRKEDKCEIVIEFFEVIFGTYHNKKDKYNLKDE